MTSFWRKSFAGSVSGSSPAINPFKEISDLSDRLSLSVFSLILKSVSMLFSKELVLSDISSANFGLHDVFCSSFGLFWFSLGERNVLFWEFCRSLNPTGFCHYLSWTAPMPYDTLSNFSRIPAASSTDFGSLFSNLSCILRGKCFFSLSIVQISLLGLVK